MSDKEYEQFFILLEKIANAEGSWQEKKEEFKSQCAANDAATVWEEVHGWFDEEAQ